MTWALLFWSRVDASGGPDACWPWTRAINASGYGSVSIQGRIRTASRVAYAMARGHIPEGPGYHGYVVMHSCDNRACCNPKHLSLGTQAENNHDRDRKGRIKSRRRGPRNHTAVFTEAQVWAIREDLAAGKSLLSIATNYGCSRAAIAHIRQGRTWGWLQ